MTAFSLVRKLIPVFLLMPATLMPQVIDIRDARTSVSVENLQPAPVLPSAKLTATSAGEVALLPALPQAWPEGRVKGLRARGGFEVDLEWRGGKLSAAAIRSARGGACRVACGQKRVTLDVPAGAAVRLGPELSVE